MKSLFKKVFHFCLLLSDNYCPIFKELKKVQNVCIIFLGLRDLFNLSMQLFIRIETVDYNNSQ